MPPGITLAVRSNTAATAVRCKNAVPARYLADAKEGSRIVDEMVRAYNQSAKPTGISAGGGGGRARIGPAGGGPRAPPGVHIKRGASSSPTKGPHAGRARSPFRCSPSSPSKSSPGKEYSKVPRTMHA